MTAEGRFTCPYDVHGEPVTLWRGRTDGTFVLLDPNLDDRKSLAIGELHASGLRRRVIELERASNAVWVRRALVDLGYIEPYPVPMLDLPDGSDALTRRVYEGVEFLFGVRMLREVQAAPISWRFGADWMGMSQANVGDGLKALLSANVIEFVRKERRTSLFLPGGFAQ